MSKFVITLILLGMIPFAAYPAVFGGKSLLHVQTASTLDPGRVEFRSDMRFYSKVADFLGGQKPANFKAYNLWDVQGNNLLSYGVVEHFDATFMVRSYQDLNFKKEFNSPDDIFLDLKVGSLQLRDNRFNFGGIFSFRFPTGDIHNYPFEPYTAGAIEYGIMGLFSYYNDGYIPERDFSLHVNLGWYYHNDAGKELFKRGGVEFTAGNNASELQYGVGFSYPTELFDLNLELFGIGYINKPDTMAFSRENYAYITPSITFKPQDWINFNLGMDIRVSSDKEESSKLLSFQSRGLDLPNYPGWKITLGANIVLLSGGRGKRGAYSSKQPIEKRIDFFENLLKEQEKSKKLEEELRRLRKERERAEKELEELRQLLEEQK